MRPIITCTFILIAVSTFAQHYNDYLGAGHTQGVVVTSSDVSSEMRAAIDGSGADHQLIETSRFLSHATLGANMELLRHVEETGFEPWLDEQFAMPATPYSHILEQIDNFIYSQWMDAGLDPEAYEVTATQFRYAWSEVITNYPDILRHRMTLALSQILVISTDSDLLQFGYGVTDYYDLLAEHAFGNYEDLLLDMAVHPCMGFYLSHLNNPRAIPSENIHPDENFAREIMQLFTIGLYELNLDGTRKVDSAGHFIPTYDNDDIKELARVFTGLGMGAWADEDIQEPPRFGVPIYRLDRSVPMKMYETWHDPRPKTILGELTIPAFQPGMEDIEMAINHLFNHPNVGPFISKLLIKQLVKSNPTPEYVARVAQTFNDNGQGVRGDLKAVLTAILLDEEARSCAWKAHETNGKLKEPIQRYTQFTRAFNATSEADVFLNGGFYYQNITEQWTMHAPTVFNFYLPDYVPNSKFANMEMVGPEFEIFNTSSSIGYANIIYFMAIIGYINDVPYELEAAGITEPFEGYIEDEILEDLSREPEALVDYLDLILAHGNMGQRTRDAIVDAISPLQGADRNIMVRLALYLTMISPDYIIMK